MPMFDNKNAAVVSVAHEDNPCNLYEHQIAAMLELNKINKRPHFSALVVLPTGAGKTRTATYWLLKNAINSHKRVLWIAHRHLLLDQAAESFVSNGYSNLLTNRANYKYRIISGNHDKPIHITGDEDILIVGKDSIIKNLKALNDWMDGQDIYVVIDEAHHAVARTYRSIIDYVEHFADEHLGCVKMIGLTATPYRTNEAEKAALGKIFPDDIIYSIDLDTLIKRGILSTPICKTYETHILAGENITSSMAKKISFSDNLPEDIANEIANNRERNHLIVRKYVQHQDEYGQTIVFALNIRHAIELNAVFRKHGIQSDFIVSDLRDSVTGITRSKEDNARSIEAYRNKEIQVLINVNILTEGTDLPQTKTVFLTRPTVSKVLMTQMVGRALRGEAAGGTKEAFIISFIDDWEDKVSFESPETVLLEGELPPDRDTEYRKQAVRYIAVSMIEEFARIVDETVDTRQLENLPFSERVPIGMYMVSYLEEDSENETSIERNHSVLVYNNSQAAYTSFLNDADSILKKFGVSGDSIDDSVIDELIAYCRETYFSDIVLPPCKSADIEALLKYFAYTGQAPALVRVSDIDRTKVNLSYIAQDMVDLRLDDFQKKDYLEKLWNDDSTLLKMYYSEFEYFKRQLDKEIDKIVWGVTSGQGPKVKYDQRELEEMTIQQIRERDPKYGEELRNRVFLNASEHGAYRCKICGMKSSNKKDFQIDHIIPMSKGGRSVISNLQLLCRKCNWRKADNVNNTPLASDKISGLAIPNIIQAVGYIIVRLGDECREFTITDRRRKRGYMTFEIGGKKYKYEFSSRIITPLS